MMNKLLAKFFLLISWLSVPLNAQQGFLFRGTVVTPETVISDGYIVVSGNKISQVSGFAPKDHNGVVETDSFIFPGLIDLHDHITWNLFPRWKPGELFSNRYEWQQRTAYKIALDVPHRKLFENHALACDADRYGELKAIVGGSTSVAGTLGPSGLGLSDNGCIAGLARNLDFYSGLYPGGVLNKEMLRYEVFPFEIGLGDAVGIRNDLTSGKLTSLLIHLAEGKPSDSSAGREFRMLQKEDLVRPGVSIIHGVALGRPQFHIMASQGMGLIWSPRSNIELYGATTDVALAKAEGITIAIAPDWSPSGSDGLLQELKYANTWDQVQVAPEDPTKYKAVFSSAELVKMATLYPAKLAGLADKIGSLRPDFYADLLLIRKTATDPYEALLHASPGDIRLVMIDGIPVYGDADLMGELLPGRQLEGATICGAKKAFFIEPVKGISETQKSLKQIAAELNTALESWGTSLAPFTICEGTNLN